MNIKLNPNNPRIIKDQKFKKLVASIKNFPKMMELRPIVVDKDGVILGGNMRFRAIQELKIDIPDNWIKVADKLTEEEKKRFIVEDNLPFGEWDWDALSTQYDYEELLEMGFDEKDLKIEQEVIEDEVPEVSDEPAISKLGEVYQLGRHRLMCGDSTKIEDVEKLMNGQKADLFLTDPPYGVSYSDKNKSLNAIAPANRIQVPIENDHMDKEDMKVLWTSAFTNAYVLTKDNAPYYINAMQGGDLMMMMMMMSILNSGWNLKHMMIWAKNNHVLGRMDYHYKHEPIFYGWKEGKTHSWYGDHSQTSLWNIDKPMKSDLHPTMKPIALLTIPINNSSKQDDIVLDLFGGSGSTLIACEQTNRTCYMMELDPKYCDVIRKRYAKFIGKEEEWQTI